MYDKFEGFPSNICAFFGFGKISCPLKDIEKKVKQIISLSVIGDFRSQVTSSRT